MELTAEELRVLCCLIEKCHTTPENYPLTTNALVTACNQKTSRDPVVDYGTNQVDRVMQQLRAEGWARTIRTSGGRANKHKHVIDEKLGLTDRQQALVAVLGLRGPQSAGELKTRTERYGVFESYADVVAELDSLAGREEPLVRNIGTGPGQSQDRWVQLLSGETVAMGEDGVDSGLVAGPPGASRQPSAPPDSRSSGPDPGPPRDWSMVVAGLRSELATLSLRLDGAEARIAELETRQY